MTTTAIAGLVGEGLVWSILFIIFVENYASPKFAQFLRKNDLWKTLELEKGAMGPNLAKDCVTMFGFGVQHFFAGSLILLGSLLGPGYLTFVRHGLLCEWGWEVKDLINLITSSGPYRQGQINENYRSSIRFHHAPGVVTTLPIIYLGFHSNLHVQRIGFIMILIGSVGILSNLARIVVSAAHPKASLQLFGFIDVLVCFGFCRFTVFPYEVLSFIWYDLIKNDYFALATLTFVAFLTMMKFNFRVFFIKLRKLRENTESKPALRLKHHSSSFHPADEFVATKHD